MSLVHGARFHISSFHIDFPAHHVLLSPEALIEQTLTRVEKAIAGQAVGHLDATAVAAVEGLSLGGAAVSVAREEPLKGGKVGGGAAPTGRGRSQAREQRAQQDEERSHLVVETREVCCYC